MSYSRCAYQVNKDLWGNTRRSNNPFRVSHRQPTIWTNESAHTKEQCITNVNIILFVSSKFSCISHHSSYGLYSTSIMQTSMIYIENLTKFHLFLIIYFRQVSKFYLNRNCIPFRYIMKHISSNILDTYIECEQSSLSLSLSLTHIMVFWPTVVVLRVSSWRYFSLAELPLLSSEQDLSS